MATITLGAETLTTIDQGKWAGTNHTAQKAELVVQTKRFAANTANATYGGNFKVQKGALDAAGAVLPQKITLDLVVRIPVSAVSADVDRAIALFQAMVADASFSDAVKKHYDLA
nr:MAG: coat protein [Leviviridae sp.]